MIDVLAGDGNVPGNEAEQSDILCSFTSSTHVACQYGDFCGNSFERHGRRGEAIVSRYYYSIILFLI